MGRKQKYTDTTAYCIANDAFAPVYNSLLMHPNFMRLKPAVRYMYICCRVQSHTKDGRACLFKHSQDTYTQYNAEQFFVFPAKHMLKYGVDRSNGRKWIAELIQAGFIEEIEQNKHRYKVNVYRFSDAWKDTS